MLAHGVEVSHKTVYEWVQNLEIMLTKKLVNVFQAMMLKESYHKM